ncbi:MAG: hypothetical protein IPG38_15980 [Chitinophagaceae bacterium]|nr:hypothetical protein [Chitinophagaceae bacterium]
MKDPVDLIADDDELPKGDGFNGDGLSNYEEYRGFKSFKDKKIVHIRTNYEVKDILIMNSNPLKLKLKLYKDVSMLNVSEITGGQYFVKDDHIYINFNGSGATHVADQGGLYLIDSKKSDKYILLQRGPSIPSYVGAVQIFTESIAAMVNAKNIEYQKQIG